MVSRYVLSLSICILRPLAYAGRVRWARENPPSVNQRSGNARSCRSQHVLVAARFSCRSNAC